MSDGWRLATRQPRRGRVNKVHTFLAASVRPDGNGAGSGRKRSA